MSSAFRDVFRGGVLLRRLSEVADHGRGARHTACGMAVQLRRALEGDLLDVGHLESDPDHYRQHLLHVDPYGRFSVVALVWRPGQVTPIHDHIAWCVSGVHTGIEREERFAPAELGGRAWLRPTTSVVNGPGVVSVLDPSKSDIHRVICLSGGERTVSVHIYGVDLSRAGTSIRVVYDIDRVLDRAWCNDDRADA